MSERLRTTAIRAGLVLALVSGSAPGQEPPSADPAVSASARTETPAAPARSYAGVEQIVVTAQRRSENLQDVPISVAAFGEEAINKRVITSFADVAKSTPGFQFSQHLASQTPTIRGVGSDRFNLSAEPGIALYVDDVYFARPFLPMVDLIDMQRIEILRGPQGTLYGRNTTGGAMKLITKDPSEELEGLIGGQYGSFDQKAGRASVAGPIIDDLRARISVYYEDRDGWLENPVRNETLNGEEIFSGKVKAKWDILDWLHLDVGGDYTDQDMNGPAGQATTPMTFGIPGGDGIPPAFYPYDVFLNGLMEQFPGVDLAPLRQRLLSELTGYETSLDPREVRQDGDTFTFIKSEGFHATLNAELFGIDAKWINGFRHATRDLTWDVDLTSFPGADQIFETSSQQESSELQLSSDTELPSAFGFSLGSLHWLAGGFFFHEKAREFVTADLVKVFVGLEGLGELIPDTIQPIFTRGNAVGVSAPSAQETYSYAGFADLQWNLREWLRLHLGTRYSVDDKDSVHSYTNPLPNQVCTDEHDSHTWSRATFRAGVDYVFDDERMVYVSFDQGYKTGGFNTFGCFQKFYDPELIKAYELGFKSQWFDQTLQFNISAFHYDYTDLQQEEIRSLSTVVVNAPKAEANGGELTVVWRPIDYLTLDGGAAYLDARYREFSQVDPYTAEGMITNTLLLPGVPGELVNLRGNRISKSPPWMVNLGIEPTYPISDTDEVSARLQWNYTDATEFDNYNHHFSRRPSYQVTDFFLTFEHALGYWQTRLGLRGFVKNLTDETYISGKWAQLSPIGGPFGYYAPPRTWGVELYGAF